jgi:uncharacterized RDD family membrane protein YckC
MSGSHEDEASSISGQQQTGSSWLPPDTPNQPSTWEPPAGPEDRPQGATPGDQQQMYGQQMYGPLPQPATQPYPGQQQPFPQQPYPPQPYAQQPPGYAPQAVWLPPVPVYPYAPWGRRVGAYLIDFAPAIVAQIPFWIGYIIFSVRLIQLSSAPTTTSADDIFADLTGSALVWMIIGLVAMIAAIGWQWYNRWLIGGRTGQSMGKRVLKTKLVAEVNGQPIGPVNAFLRDLLHVLDGAAYVGYLWPLWDAKRQTFSDMIMKTVVVDQRGQQAAGPGAGGPHDGRPDGQA